MGTGANALLRKPKFACIMKIKLLLFNVHTYHSRFIPEGVAEVSQIFPRDTHVLPKFVSYEEHLRGGKPIAVLLQSISSVSAINPLVAFYDIYEGKREVLFFYFVPTTTRDYHYCLISNEKYSIIS
jgi:hypothetical protein